MENPPQGAFRSAIGISEQRVAWIVPSCGELHFDSKSSDSWGVRKIRRAGFFSQKDCWVRDCASWYNWSATGKNESNSQDEARRFPVMGVTSPAATREELWGWGKSTNATDRLRRMASQTMAQPAMPPPTTTTSKVFEEKFS